MAHMEYDTKYVRRGKNSQQFAERIKNTLNELTKNNWEIVITQLEAKGMLIMARRIAKTVLDDIYDHFHSIPVMVIGGQAPVRLTKDASEFVNGVLQGIESSELKVVLEKLPKVAPAICRKYTNDRLRSIMESIKAFRDDHVKNHSETCETTQILDALLKHVDESVRLAVC